MSSSAPDDTTPDMAAAEPTAPEVARLARASAVCGLVVLVLFYAIYLPAALLPLLLRRPEMLDFTAPVGLVAANVAALPGGAAAILAWRVRRRGVRPLLSDAWVARATLLGFTFGLGGLLFGVGAWAFELAILLSSH